MSTHIALMRGINVGGRNRVLMADLASLFEEAGAHSVRTCIQSGNVIFDASSKTTLAILGQVRQGLRERFHVDAPIALRSSTEFLSVLDQNPFLREGRDSSHLHVGFLLETPDRAAVERLDPARSDIDSFWLAGRELYLHVPGGMARTSLTTAYFDRCLGTVVTVRNWRTVTRLAELLR